MLVDFARSRQRRALPAWPAPALLAALVAAPALLQLVLEWRRSTAPDLIEAGLPLWVCVCLTTTTAALLGRLRRLLPILVPAAVLAPIECFYLSAFGLPSGSHVFGVLAETNPEEVSSWLGPWAGPALGVGLLLVALVGWAAHRCWRADWRWHHRSRIWVLAAAAVFSLGWAALELAEPKPPDQADAVASGSVHPHLRFWLTDAKDGVAPRLESSFPWGLPLRFWRFHAHRQAVAAHRETTAHHDFGVRWRTPPVAAPVSREVHVLVIGETARPDRWALFGAARDTTPRLSKRRDLLRFTDAVSAASATRESVSLMLTRRPPGQALAPSTEPSLVTAFKQAGFRTYWLSTQGAAGAHETPVSVLSQEADERRYVNAVDYRSAGAYDGVLLPLLQEVLARNEARQLIVLHTLGSHLHYAHRYPPEFEHFKPAFSPAEPTDIWSDRRKTELVNAYDNSVRYTDWLLDNVIEQIDRSGAAATLVYAADHGEALFDGHCRRGGHGFAALVNYRIPMLVWLSPVWRERWPDAASALQSRTALPVSTLAMFGTLTGLAGFDIAAPHAHGGLADAAWRPAARLVTHFGDFDRDLPGRACDR